MQNASVSSSLAPFGSGFRQVSPGTLLEIGDELQGPDGVFRALPLHLVGTPVPPAALARRVERTASSY